MVENAKGTQVKPIRLLSDINTNYNEDSPFIAPDESYLLFESDRPGGMGGLDLYISFKSEIGEWSGPSNLSNKINSKADERFARVSPDGKFLFFGSNRRQIKNKANFDIYWIDGSAITAPRENR